MKLIPLPVPWQIRADMPCLQLLVCEDTGYQETEISFEASVLPPANKDGPMQLQIVKVVFESSGVARMNPPFEEYELLDPGKYDWGAVPRLTLDDDLETFKRRRDEQWRRTGFCPNPRCYEVKDSEWLRELGGGGEGHKWTHYLALGRDRYVDVIANGWRWCTEEVLRDELY